MIKMAPLSGYIDLRQLNPYTKKGHKIVSLFTLYQLVEVPSNKVARLHDSELR